MKKFRGLSFVVVLFAAFFVFTFSARADLFNRGTDSMGNRLIYDSDLNITWYDYSNFSGYPTWNNQVSWASGLTVNFGGTIYDDWRLPNPLNQDGTGPCVGYNCTGSEMGHLFYTELGNKGYFDTAGSPTGCNDWPNPDCFSNTGDFQHLYAGDYWHVTYSGSLRVGIFNNNYGYQGQPGGGNEASAIAVRSGDVAVVPEPISSILFMTGGATLIGRKYIRRKKIEV